MKSNEFGPQRQVQIAFIAERHYLQGKTRIEIADETGLSRFKVGRLLDEAISSGMVKFEISSPTGIDLRLSRELKERFGLQHGIVVDVPSDAPEVMQERLGSTAADFLTEILTESDVLGLTSGRTINALARSLTELPECGVVQLAGVAGLIQETGIEVLRRVSNVAGVSPWTIYSPLVVSDAQTATGIRRQPDTKATFDQFSRVTVAVVGVGSWSPPDSLMMKNPALTPSDLQSLIDLGVLAEIGATLIGDGGKIFTQFDSRCIAIAEPELRRVPHVVAVAGGLSKARSLRAVLDSKLVHSLVTDVVAARLLLRD